MVDNGVGSRLYINFVCSAATDITIDTIVNIFEVGGFIGVGRDEWYNVQYYVHNSELEGRMS